VTRGKRIGQESQSAVVGQFEMVASMATLPNAAPERIQGIPTEAESTRGILNESPGWLTRAAPDRRRFQVIDALKQLFLCCSPFSRSDAPCE
jgi:hypothetical protein